MTPQERRALIAEADEHHARAREHQAQAEACLVRWRAAMDQAEAAHADAERSWDAYLLEYQPAEWAAVHGLAP